MLPLLYSNFSSPHDIVVVNFGNWHGPRSEPKSQEYVSAYKQALRLLGSFYLVSGGLAVLPQGLDWCFARDLGLCTPCSVISPAISVWLVAVDNSGLPPPDYDWPPAHRAPHRCQTLQATMETRPHLIFQESASTHPYDLASQGCVNYSDPAAVGGGSFNKAAQEVLRDYSIPVVGNAAAFTAPAPWAHPGARAQGGRDGAEQGDCMHFCSPGVTEVSVRLVFIRMGKLSMLVCTPRTQLHSNSIAHACT